MDASFGVFMISDVPSNPQLILKWIKNNTCQKTTLLYTYLCTAEKAKDWGGLEAGDQCLEEAWVNLPLFELQFVMKKSPLGGAPFWRLAITITKRGKMNYCDNRKLKKDLWKFKLDFFLLF